MTELSPAAQAVLDATKVNFYEEQPSSAQLAAWILSAAADHVQHHWDGMECVDHLQAIAAELEGANS